MSARTRTGESVARCEAECDEAARDLDRKRAAADRRPDDMRAQLAHAEARAAYEAARAELEAARVADLATRNAQLQRGLRRALTAITEKQAFIDRWGNLTGATRRVRRIAARDETGGLLALIEGAEHGGRM
jgi:multidrug resistance efflux pump